MGIKIRNTISFEYIWRMKAKWYISALIIILTLFGAISQQQITVPNQEIVLQFTNTSITSQDTQNTIAIVKKQLQDLGVSNIKIKEEENGKLVITYYSDTDVASIKKTFTKEKNIVLDYAFSNQNEDSSKLPFDEEKISYNLDVYEIQNGSDVEWDLNGVSVVELKAESNRFSNPNIYAFINAVEINKSIEKVAYKIHYNIAIAIDNTSYKIPEVRAGPLA
ncbi:hypothetical protein [Wocania ichthyoenteri]|uniref:hypothetical protein n=1 Tax=Wocania ichthyoenteri TaxID=1230531 RepID=UPI00053E724F|nr:hypothetical protein [Wocania ichthyoenteri]